MLVRNQKVLQPPQIDGPINDLVGAIGPRHAVIDHRRWMEPYHDTEVRELGERLHAVREQPLGFGLWQRAYALHRDAFLRKHELPETSNPSVERAFALRSKLLGLAGIAAKPTLDALLAGYYWTVFGQLRNILEAWRYVAYLRLDPDGGSTYLKLPRLSPIRTDGSIRSEADVLDYKTVKAVVDALGTDKDKKYLELSSAGFAHFHGGAHPSAHAMLQLDSETGTKLVFGPNYNPALCAFCLQWGLAGLIMLLDEVHQLTARDEQWLLDYDDLVARYREWLDDYNRTYKYGQRDRLYFDLAFLLTGDTTDFDAAMQHVLSTDQLRDRLRRIFQLWKMMSLTDDEALEWTRKHGVFYGLEPMEVDDYLFSEVD